MPSLPSDSSDPISRTADELAELRRSIDSLGDRLGELTHENGDLRRKLELSETARGDLMAQTEHLLELLGDSRRQLRELWAQNKSESDG